MAEEKSTSQSNGDAAGEKGVTIISTTSHISKYSRRKKSKNRIIRISDIPPEQRFGGQNE